MNWYVSCFGLFVITEYHSSERRKCTLITDQYSLLASVTRFYQLGISGWSSFDRSRCRHIQFYNWRWQMSGKQSAVCSIAHLDRREENTKPLQFKTWNIWTPELLLTGCCETQGSRVDTCRIQKNVLWTLSCGTVSPCEVMQGCYNVHKSTTNDEPR